MDFTKDIYINKDKIYEDQEIVVLYKGFLFSNNLTNDVYISLGYGNMWDNKEEIRMKPSTFGYLATVKVGSGETLQFCFRDGNGNWDNNNYANYILPILENEEILEMVSSFNITPKELNESISLINNNKFSELQDLINKNIIIADGFVFCKKRNLIRLNNFIAYDIKKNNIQLHAGMYDFHPLIRELVKLYGRKAKEEFNRLYGTSVKDALEKCKILLSNDLSLNGVSAISTLVKKYPEMFTDNNMKVGPIPEEMARMIFSNLDPNLVWGAYISREELLKLSKKY